MTGFSRRCGILVAFSLLLLAASPPAQEQRAAKIKFMVGTVKVRKGAQTQWRDAKPNMSLGSKDAIRTFVESRAEIETDEGTIIRVEENSTMELTNLSRNAGNKTEDTKVKMMSGKVWANVKKLGNTRSSFAFETPTATAAIRGTELSLEVDENGTQVKVYEGIVYVAPSGGGSGAAVGANQMTFVRKGQRSVKIEKLQEKTAGDSAKTTDTTANADSTAKVDSAAVDSGKTVPDTAAAADTSKPVPSADTAKPVVPAAPKDTAKVVPPSGGMQRDTTKTGLVTPPAGSPVPPGTAPVLPITPGVPPAGSSSVPATDTALSRAAAPTTPALRLLPLTLTVSKPAADNEVTTGGAYTVTGKTTSDAVARVNGKPVTVSSAGDFSAALTLPAVAGPFGVDVEAVRGSETKSISRTLQIKPVLAPLTLTVTKPASDGEVTTGGPYTVQGKTVAGTEVRVNGKTVPVSAVGDFTAALTLPAAAGPFTVDIEAVRGSEAKSISRSLQIQPPSRKLTLVVNTPKEGAVVTTTNVPVSGLTAIGATVTVNGLRVPVTPNGSFSTNAPISEDENVVIEVEAELEGASAPVTVTRNIRYEKPKIALTLIVATPASGTKIKNPRVLVQGQTTGREVTVNGDPATVMNGQFTYNLMVGESKNWDMTEITVVASADGEEVSKIVPVVVDKEAPGINTSAPAITASLPGGSATKNNRIYITVSDKTHDDEITLTSKIDGEVTTEVFSSGEKAAIALLEGTHEYVFSAMDKAKNKSNILSWRGALIGRAPTILLRNPASGSEKKALPPNGPDDDFSPAYALQFEVQGLPNDDYTLLKEVKVSNAVTGYSRSMTSFSGIDFSFDVDLKRNATNTIMINVTDKSDNTVQKQAVITTW